MEFFYFDIETAGQHSNYTSLKNNDELGASLFHKKYESNLEGDIADVYREKSPIITTYGRIVCISFGVIHTDGSKKINSFYGNDEKLIVTQFNNLLKRIEQSNYILFGFRISNFDIPWIVHKLHKYDIEPSDFLYLYDKKPWESRIRDLADDWRLKSYYNHSFDEICYELDVISPKSGISGKDVHDLYWNDRYNDIKTYCEGDVSALIDISKKIYKL